MDKLIGVSKISHFYRTELRCFKSFAWSWIYSNQVKLTFIDKCHAASVIYLLYLKNFHSQNDQWHLLSCMCIHSLFKAGAPVAVSSPVNASLSGTCMLKAGGISSALAFRSSKAPWATLSRSGTRILSLIAAVKCGSRRGEPSTMYTGAVIAGSRPEESALLTQQLSDGWFDTCFEITQKNVAYMITEQHNYKL